MAEYYHGGRAMYSNTTDECYDAGRHMHGHGHGHGHGGGSMRAYSSRTDEYYDNVQDDCAYNGGGYGGRQTAVYTDEYSRGGGYGGYGAEQEQYFKREEKEHKQKERLGEVGALAGGAFALYEGHRAKKDPANAQRHKIEAGVAAAAALGAGGYAYHEHREQKEAHYETKQQEHRVPHGYYCN